MPKKLLLRQKKKLSTNNQHRNTYIFFIKVSAKKAIWILSCKLNNWPRKKWIFKQFSPDLDRFSSLFVYMLLISVSIKRHSSRKFRVCRTILHDVYTKWKIYCCVFTLSLKLWIWNFYTMSFGRLSHRIVLKRMLHVQHDYFSSFIQSDHCFLALLLPSSLPKLRILL